MVRVFYYLFIFRKRTFLAYLLQYYNVQIYSKRFHERRFYCFNDLHISNFLNPTEYIFEPK